MFDKRLLITGAAIAITAAAAFVFTAVPELPEVVPIDETVSGIERKPQSAPEPAPEPGGEGSYQYTLKEHEGRIAVFAAGSAEPELILDVLIKYLPDLDRTQMQEGIPVKDYEELVRLIEDYTS